MNRTIFLALLVIAASVCALAQEPAAITSTTVIKAETREVLVDTIVTDKQGHYIKGLTAKDFRVWEDNKEQKVKSFTYAADPASAAAKQSHYLVLFFDNSSMNFGDQSRARIAAARFIDANGGLMPDQMVGSNVYIAVFNFGGTLQIAQNFTQDTVKLKKVVTSMNSSAVSTGDYFGVRTVLLALRSLAKTLQSIPGRKSLVFLSSGFEVTPELEYEVAAAIDACNKSNVAVYPIDVRGLVAGLIRPKLGNSGDFLQTQHATSPHNLTAASLRWTGDKAPANGGARLLYVGQRAGGGTGTGGGGAPRAGGGGVGSGPRTGGGGTVAPRPVTGSFNRTPGTTPGITMPHPIVPPLLPNVAGNQQVLRQLADGTGGFVIVNSNDLLDGMQKVGEEGAQYYILGYEPPEADDGSCHTLKVKVDRNNTMVRARTGYCNVKPVDLLAGKPIEKELESRANGTQAGVSASMMPSFFYTSANTARVDLAIDVPSNAIKFDKDKGKYKASVNVLGMAYKPDGTVAAKFSDTANLEMPEKKDLEEFQKVPYHYENQFDIACGTYTLKVAFTSGGESFGKLESPLVVDAYDNKHFAMSGLVLSRQMVRVTDTNAGVESELIEDKKPFISQGIQLVPSGTNHFKKTDSIGAYVELYAPLLLQENPPKVSLRIMVLDLKTSKPAINAAITDTAQATKPGSPVVPLALRIPTEKLNAGSYRLELQAVDTAGNLTKIRTTDFELQ